MLCLFLFLVLSHHFLYCEVKVIIYHRIIIYIIANGLNSALHNDAGSLRTLDYIKRIYLEVG